MVWIEREREKKIVRYPDDGSCEKVCGNDREPEILPVQGFLVGYYYRKKMDDIGHIMNIRFDLELWFLFLNGIPRNFCFSMELRSRLLNLEKEVRKLCIGIK